MQRDISTYLVERVLEEPDGVIRQSADKIIAHKRIGGRSDNAIAVVAVQRSTGFHVVTVLINFEAKDESAS